MSIEESVKQKLGRAKFAIAVDAIDGVTPIPMFCETLEAVNAAPVPLNRGAKVLSRDGKTVATKAANESTFTWL